MTVSDEQTNDVTKLSNERIAKFLRTLVLAIRSGVKFMPNENSAAVMDEAASRLALDRRSIPSRETVAWLHPTAGWASEDREKVAMHCIKTGPQPVPLYASPIAAAPEGWRPIKSAPTLDRVIVAGWQPRHGNTAGYWWYYEDMTDENGVPMDQPKATMWHPFPKRPTQEPSP